MGTLQFSLSSFSSTSLGIHLRVIVVLFTSCTCNIF
uniref:Uncharacterized protein n=1 Tax=Rhizophora mucronata TaxID=61149 RepID=A0A2P2NKD4_RHIMU